MSKTLILCDCSGSQEIDAEGLSRTTGLSCSKVHNALCTTQAEAAASAIAKGDAIFCCAQEQPFFEALADETGHPAPACVDLRDRAGWSADEASKLPKMSALIAEAMLPATPTKTVDVISEGTCLIIGDSEIACRAAGTLRDFLAVTVLLTDAETPVFTRDYDILRGTLRAARGALGGFEVVIDRLQQMQPAGRGDTGWTAARDGGRSQCDIILDLGGGAALFPAPEKREGYLFADPRDPHAVDMAVMQASHLAGTFEKPLYVRLEPLLCAHSRAGQAGCSRCIDNCPTGAISPDGDHVAIDPMVCAGCGSCSALCPSGALSYDAPPTELTMRRIQTLSRACLDAGGDAPELLVVDPHGSEMIRLSARYGRGLPARVIPMEVPTINGFGHAEIVAALGAGFARVHLLPSRSTERAVMDRETALARALDRAETVSVIDTDDPDQLSAALFEAAEVPAVGSPVRPMGTRRQITRTATKARHPEGGILALPEGAPYGAVTVDTEACTLCLSCASLCPSGALGDNPDLPQLRFQEDACLQCGLCAHVCPENAITLVPRMNLDDEALQQQVLNEEEPFACIECGALFGVKSTIERVTEKLSGSHAKFANPEALRLIQMCDDCRVNAQFHSEDNPFAAGDRPRVRTTEDYLSKRRDH